MGGQIYRNGNVLIVADGTALPDVCLVTGQPTGGKVQNDTPSWIPPWTIVAFVLVRLVGIVLMLVMRKSARFSYYWSEEARKKRSTGIWIGIGITVASVLGFVLAMTTSGGNEDVAIIAALGLVLLFLAGIIVAAVVGKPYQVKKIKDGYIHLQVKPAFWEGMQRAGIQVGHFPG